MIRIVKSPEPPELRDYRENSPPEEGKPSYEKMKRRPSGHFNRLSGESINLHDYVLSKLLKDQGHLCAYCMSKLPERNKETGRELEPTIEHIDPQSTTKNTPKWKKEIEYSNFLAVCSGNAGQGPLCCDKARGAKPLALTPLDPQCNHRIEYSLSGAIKASQTIPSKEMQDAINDELNNVLNLNFGKDLKAKRKSALDGMMVSLQKAHQDQNIDACKRKLQELKAPKDPKPEYVGILIFWLEKHITKLEHRT